MMKHCMKKYNKFALLNRISSSIQIIWYIQLKKKKYSCNNFESEISEDENITWLNCKKPWRKSMLSLVVQRLGCKDARYIQTDRTWFGYGCTYTAKANSTSGFSFRCMPVDRIASTSTSMLLYGLLMGNPHICKDKLRGIKY